MALGIAKIYLGLPFSANRRCSRSVGSRSVCRGKLSWNRKISLNFGKDLFFSGTFFRASFLGTVLFLVNENMVPLVQSYLKELDF